MQQIQKKPKVISRISRYLEATRDQTTQENSKSQAGSQRTQIEPQRDWMDFLINKQVTMQSNRGIIYEGNFCGMTKDRRYYVLSKARIVGTKNIAEVDLLLVRPEMIFHMHTMPSKLEPRAKG